MKFNLYAIKTVLTPKLTMKLDKYQIVYDLQKKYSKYN
jgi:hypothetical protein